MKLRSGLKYAGAIATGLAQVAGLKRAFGQRQGSNKRQKTGSGRNTRVGRKLKNRNGTSKTKRKRRGGRTQTVYQGGDTSSKSGVAIRYKPQKIFGTYKALSGNLQYSGTYSSQLMTTQGQTLARQYSKVIGTIMTGTNYDSVLQAYYNNLHSSNPYFQKYPQILNGDVGIKPLFTNITQKYEMLNQTEAATHVDIYTVMCNNSQDDYEDPISCWTNAIIYDKGGSAGTTPTVNFPQDKPINHKAFNRKWKIVKITSVELLPGVTHTHFFSFSPKRIVDYMHSQEYRMIKGITYATFLIARGTIVDNTKGVQGTQTVSYSPVKIDYVVTEHYNWRLLNVLPANQYYTNAMGNLTYDETVTGALYQQNAVSGAGPTNLNDETLMG